MNRSGTLSSDTARRDSRMKESGTPNLRAAPVTTITIPPPLASKRPAPDDAEPEPAYFSSSFRPALRLSQFNIVLNTSA